MQRTNYWNQTRPTDTQLNWTETSKSNAINQRLRSSAQMGIAWGYRVTVNSVDNTKIDIARGEGYSGGMFLVNEFETAGSGQRISTYTDTPSGIDDTGPAADAQGLADYTAGVNNYISLTYAEVALEPLAERTYPFTSRQTVVTETFTVSVLTETQWNALDSEALNNRILVGIVTARGAGVALTSADIDQFVQPKTLPTTSQPSLISGVTIIGIADVTPLGIGTLRWDTATNQIYWTAPGDSEGVGFAISNSGVYTVYSNNTNYSIELNVVWGSLLILAVDTSENISVRSLYGRSIPMFSATDQIHRDMVGSGQPSGTNPHALTLADIGGGTLDHADLFHVNGISKDADATQLAPFIAAVGPLDYIQINSLGGFENSFLVDGVTLTEVSGSDEVHFSTVPFPDDGEYLIYVDSAGNLEKVQIGNALWTTNIYLVDMINTVAGTGTIAWDSTAVTGGYLTYQAPGDVGPGANVYLMASDPGAAYSGYYKLYSSNTDNWILVEVTGALGVSVPAQNITIVKDETNYAEETMLKICVVNWVGGTQTLSSLRDIRSFITADNRSEAQEDHDTAGQHTKVLQNRLRVRVSSAEDGALMGVAGTMGVWGSALSHSGIVGLAASNVGVYGSADNIGMFGLAANDTGGAFVADNTAVYGTASSIYGGFFRASSSALLASAIDDSAGIFIASEFGVYGTASNRGVCGVAGTDYGGSFSALSHYGVWGTASSLAVAGQAGVVTGAYGYAPNTGVVGEGALHVGVYGRAVAGDTGACGQAAVATGVYGTAVNFGVYGLVASNTGVYGGAVLNVGVYGSAGVDSGVVGHAIADTGVFGQAVSFGVYGYAATYGIYGTADDKIGAFAYAPNTGAFCIAGVDTAIYASADGNIGVYAVADVQAVYGTADGSAVVGSASNSLGVVGVAKHWAGFFSADGNLSANVVGMYAIAENAGTAENAVAVHGSVVGDAATAIFGRAANAVEGTAIYGEAVGAVGAGVLGSGYHGLNGIGDAYGVHGTAVTIGVYGGAATGVYGLGTIGGRFWADSIALDLSCPAVASPTSVVSYMPISYKGSLMTIPLSM